MKELEFEDYSAKFEDADGDEHTQTVSAAVLTKDNYHVGNDSNGRPIPREFQVVGRSEKVRATPDMVVVKTDKPDEYDVHSVDTWKEMGFATGKAKTSASGSSK